MNLSMLTILLFLQKRYLVNVNGLNTGEPLLVLRLRKAQFRGYFLLCWLPPEALRHLVYCRFDQLGLFACFAGGPVQSPQAVQDGTGNPAFA